VFGEGSAAHATDDDSTHPRAAQRGEGELCDQSARVGETDDSTQPVLQSRRNLLNHLEAKISGFAAKPRECLTDTQPSKLMTRVRFPSPAPILRKPVLLLRAKTRRTRELPASIKPVQPAWHSSQVQRNGCEDRLTADWRAAVQWPLPDPCHRQAPSQLSFRGCRMRAQRRLFLPAMGA
jgi:hypothetical protein